MWILVVPSMLFANVAFYDYAYDILDSGDNPAETRQVTTTTVSDLGDKPKPEATAAIGASPEATRKPKRKQAATASPSAAPSASVLPSTTPTGSATSEPATTTPTKKPTPIPSETTTSPSADETTAPSDGNDSEPVVLPTVPITVIVDIE